MTAQITSGIANGSLWGDRAADWAEIQEGQCRAVYEQVFAHANVGPATNYFDAGCGAGMAAQIAASLGAHVSGLDAAEALLAIARTRTPSADLRRGELEFLSFPDDSFNLVTGFNAFQYAADPAKALSEAKRVAFPGGTVVIMTWGEPAGMPAAQLVAALRPLLPSPPPGAPGPFALSARPALEAFGTSAGLYPLEVLDVNCPWQYPDLATALRGLDSSGVAAKARAHAGEAAVTQAHAEALHPFRRANGSYRIAATFRCLFTRA